MPTDDKTGFEPARSVPHPKRAYEEKLLRPLKDVDSAERVMKAKALVWSVAVAAIGFGVLAMASSYSAPSAPMMWIMRAGIVAAAVGVYFMATSIARAGGSVAGTIYHPSGRSTPVKHEYSYPESLAARGRYEEATVAYEAAVSEFPEDPEPYLRIARLYRDKLKQYEQSVFWFKRARSDSAISRGQELLATQEIIEIYRTKLGTPTRAIPELARILDRFPDDQSADRAREELTTLKEQLREEFHS